jgi:hypothetical protein
MGAYRAQSFAGQPQDWVCRGYRGSGSVESLFDSLLGRTALVVGSGAHIESILDDVSKFPDAVVFAVNDIGMYLPKVDHFVSLHSEKLLHWAGVRRDGSSKPIHPEFKTHTARDQAGVDYCWGGLTPLMALSGYFAMQIAWIMGAQKIILIGCPGDATRRFFDAKPKPGQRYSEMGIRDQIEKEMVRIPDFRRAVRSTSGWTKEFFGGA